MKTQELGPFSEWIQSRQVLGPFHGKGVDVNMQIGHVSLLRFYMFDQYCPVKSRII